MYLEVETKVALALIAALMFWRHRQWVAVRANPLFEQAREARESIFGRGEYAAAS